MLCGGRREPLQRVARVLETPTGLDLPGKWVYRPAPHPYLMSVAAGPKCFRQNNFGLESTAAIFVSQPEITPRSWGLILR